MLEDETLKRYLSDNRRYADLINGFVFAGEEILKAEDLTALDTQVGYHRKEIGAKRQTNMRYRDLLRKTQFGTNFAVVGAENQKQVHYLMTLRCMEYDLKEYQRQETELKVEFARIISKSRRISDAEFLSRVSKEARLHPCITLVLYFGDEWDGYKELHELIDFADMPDALRNMVNNYRLNLIDVKRLESTKMYHSDLRQVFDFIRFSEDKCKLKELVESDRAYAELAEDAYDVIALFTNSEELIRRKESYRKGDKQDMCKALKDWAEEERREGKLEERVYSLRALMSNLGLTLEKAMDALNIPPEERAQCIAEIK